MNNRISDPLLSIPDAGAYLGDVVSTRTLERLIRSGDLPSVRIASRRFLRVSDLEAYLNRGDQ